MTDERLKRSLDQTRARLENQREMMNQVGDRALRNIRVNLAIVGIFVSVVSVSLTSIEDPAIVENLVDNLSNLASYTAIGAAVVSVFCGLFAYIATPSIVGFSSEDSKRAREMIEDGVANDEFLILLLRSHEKWMEENSQAQLIDTYLLNGSIIFLLLEMEYFAVSVASVVFELSRTTVHSLVFIITILTGGLLTIALVTKLRFPGE